jgi:anti-anti-sigma regulatory factor
LDSIKVTFEPGETRVVLGSVLDVAQARMLYDKLDGALAAAEPFALDGAAVDRVDAAALQLLVAFSRAARDAGLALRWQEASPALRDAAALLDLAGLLEMSR